MCDGETGIVGLNCRYGYYGNLAPRGDLPPMLVVHGEKDMLIPAADVRAFAERVRAVSSCPAIYAELPGTPRLDPREVDRAVRRYLLAGLLACGRCGRRLESAWSNGKPAYRCRHGYASAARPDPGRPKNTYVHEDQILPHLAAVAILLASGGQAQGSGTLQITDPGETACLIDRLRTAGVSLTFDPDTRTIRTGGNSAAAVTVGRNS